MSTPAELLRRLVDALVASGSLLTPPWIAAFGSVPRHLFLPRFFRQSADLSGWEAVSATDPGMLELIYTDSTWVTQLDNDPRRWQAARASGEPTPGTATSSSTTPGLMALMLEALDIHDGHRVLEIGTGSGYNAGVLCQRLGSDRVTTVEVDPVVAGDARASLYAAGYRPAVVAADGDGGHPERAPYDRLLATCSTPAIPPAWVAQVSPGGLILSSLHRDLGGGPLLLLRVSGTGHAEGHFLPDYGGFMPARAHPPANAVQLLTTAMADRADAAGRSTALTPEIFDDPDFGMVAALVLSGVATIGFVPDSGPQRWLLADDGSWARYDEPTGSVVERGGRRLWSEVEAAYERWVAAGSPSRERYGMTVTPDRQWLWLDHPGHAVPASHEDTI